MLQEYEDKRRDDETSIRGFTPMPAIGTFSLVDSPSRGRKGVNLGEISDISFYDEVCSYLYGRKVNHSFPLLAVGASTSIECLVIGHHLVFLSIWPLLI